MPSNFMGGSCIIRLISGLICLIVQFDNIDLISIRKMAVNTFYTVILAFSKSFYSRILWNILDFRNIKKKEKKYVVAMESWRFFV